MRLVLISAAVAALAVSACSQQANDETAAAGSAAVDAADKAPAAASEAVTTTTTAAESAAAAATAASAQVTTPVVASAQKAALPITNAAGQPMTGDLVSGKKIFNQCMVCHDTKAGVNKVGPSLHGIIGRQAGTVPNFRYSAANKNSGITWTPQELFVYLENPAKRIPGTFMAFTGVKNPQQRADVIAFLIENTK